MSLTKIRLGKIGERAFRTQASWNKRYRALRLWLFGICAFATDRLPVMIWIYSGGFNVVRAAPGWRQSIEARSAGCKHELPARNLRLLLAPRAEQRVGSRCVAAARGDAGACLERIAKAVGQAIGKACRDEIRAVAILVPGIYFADTGNV